MLWIELKRSGRGTLTQQLYDQLVGRILDGELAAGTKLPSSREVASELKIARNIAVEVFNQLLAEGYVEARRGAGTFVAKLEFLQQPRRRAVSAIRGREAPRARAMPPFSPSGQTEQSPAKPDAGRITFACGVPDLGRFPRARWLSCTRQIGFNASDPVWGYDSAIGSPALRTEIAAHLRQVKGIACTPEQLVITSGGANGLLLLGWLFREIQKNGALIEDPVVSFVPKILQRCGHDLTPVAADGNGLRVEALPARPKAGFICVSPSHQFPLGGTLPIQRRLVLLEYARRHDLFVVEDDYDSEFRFEGAPISSLFRVDPRRAIHLGTFSKSLSPALRLGFIVLPVELVPALQRVLEPLHLTGSRFNQEVLARFIRGGHLVRHVARMKRVYARKMHTLHQALAAAFGDRVTVSGNTTGLHLVATFADETFAPRTRETLLRHGVEFETVDDYALGRSRHPGALALGYGNLSLEQIAAGVQRLAAGLHAHAGNR